MASAKIIVLVSDKGDSRHGEISVLDDVDKAQRLVETLLEAGFEEERIKVFTGKASEFQVSHRPVVALVAEGGAGERPPTADSESPETAAQRGRAEAEAAESPAEEETKTDKKEAEAPAAQMAAPVRFSSLFRSA